MTEKAERRSLGNIRGLLSGGFRRGGIYQEDEKLTRAFDQEAAATGADIERAVELNDLISNHFQESFRLAKEGDMIGSDRHSEMLEQLTDELNEILGPIHDRLLQRGINPRS